MGLCNPNPSKLCLSIIKPAVPARRGCSKIAKGGEAREASGGKWRGVASKQVGGLGGGRKVLLGLLLLTRATVRARLYTTCQAKFLIDIVSRVWLLLLALRI